MSVTDVTPDVATASSPADKTPTAPSVKEVRDNFNERAHAKSTLKGMTIFVVSMAVYLIGRGLLNPVAGLAGAALFIPHALSIYLSSLAGSDAIVALLVAWAALAAIFLAQRPTWTRAVLLGVEHGSVYATDRWSGAVAWFGALTVTLGDTGSSSRRGSDGRREGPRRSGRRALSGQGDRGGQR